AQASEPARRLAAPRPGNSLHRNRPTRQGYRTSQRLPVGRAAGCGSRTCARASRKGSGGVGEMELKWHKLTACATRRYLLQSTYQESMMIVTTGNEIEGRQIAGYLGIVRGIVVRSPSIGQNFLGGLKQIIGGNIEA